MRGTAFIFLGREDALKEEAVEDLKRRFFTNGALDLNYSVFYPDQIEPHAFQDAVKTQPFLDSKRLVVIKDFERLKGPARDSLLSYLKNPSASTILVLLAGQDARKTGADKDPFLSEASGYAVVKTFEPLEATALNNYLKEKAASCKKAITEEALELLTEKLGNNLAFLKRALEELATYVGAKPRIERQDVEALVGKSLGESVFALTRAICRRRLPESLSVLTGLLKGAVSPENIIGAIGAEFRRILRIKYLIAQGRDQRQIQDELRLNWQTVGELTRVAERMKLGAFKACFECLLKADRDCKSRDSDKKITLESLVVRLCGLTELS